jgi:hypothetical protein
MAKTNRNSSTRKPIKAKGALPAPKVAPRRKTRVVFTRRRMNQALVALGALVVLALGGLGVKLILDARHQANQRASETSAVRKFDQKFTALISKAGQSLSDMNSAPEEFRSGKIAGADFKKKTDEWVLAIKEFDKGLRSVSIPTKQSQLTETRALFVNGVVGFLDAAKIFGLAATTTDPASRTAALDQGKTLLSHGGSVFGLGQRALNDLKQKYGLPTTGQTGQAGQIVLPEEEISPSPSKN